MQRGRARPMQLQLIDPPAPCLGPPAASAAAGKAQRLQRPEKCSASEMSFCPNCNQSQKLLLSGRVLRSPDGPQEKSRATGRMQGH